MDSSKGISRRGFLGAMKATAAAATVNPTVAIQQTLPQIAKASASILIPSSYTYDGMRWVLVDALEHGYFDPFSQSSFEKALKDAKNIEPFEINDLVQDFVFCSDLADALTDSELTKFFIDCEDSHVSEILKDCLTPNDVRHVFS